MKRDGGSFTAKAVSVVEKTRGGLLWSRRGSQEGQAQEKGPVFWVRRGELLSRKVGGPFFFKALEVDRDG